LDLLCIGEGWLGRAGWGILEDEGWKFHIVIRHIRGPPELGISPFIESNVLVGANDTPTKKPGHKGPVFCWKRNQVAQTSA
jgi:hypothetical protein